MKSFKKLFINESYENMDVQQVKGTKIKIITSNVDGGSSSQDWVYGGKSGIQIIEDDIGTNKINIKDVNVIPYLLQDIFKVFKKKGIIDGSDEYGDYAINSNIGSDIEIQDNDETIIWFYNNKKVIEYDKKSLKIVKMPNSKKNELAYMFNSFYDILTTEKGLLKNI
jgi:hypothetical protein